MELLSRSRADDFQRALSGGGADSGHAHHVALAHRLRAAGDQTALTPSPAFRAALRTRLLAVAAVQGLGEPARPAPPVRAAVSWRRRAAAVTAGVTATVVALTGVAVASSRSLPGDPFYAVKRTTEAVQLQAADGPRAEGVRHLQFAETRLREVRALVLGRDAPAYAVADAVAPREVAAYAHDALADMDTDTRIGVGLLTASFRSTRDTSPLQDLQRFAAAQGSGLRAVLPALSGPSLLRAEQSLVLLEGVRAEAGELLLLDCTATCDPAQVAPLAPGTEAPCDCSSTTVPAPRTAPPPAVPQGEQPTPGGPGQPTVPTEPAPGPGSGTAPPPEPPALPPPSPRPTSGLPLPSLPPLPGLPLPGQPLPGLPLPSLPPLQPLGPDGPTVRLPGELLPGLVGALPGTLASAGAPGLLQRLLGR